MAIDCTASCLVTAPAFDVVAGCGLKSNTRSGYIKGFVATRCDVTVADIADANEIETYLSAGTMFYAPPGTGTLPFPTTSDEIQENCDIPVAMRQQYAFSYESYRVDNTNLTDDAAWESIRESIATWRIAPITCDDIILVDQSFTTTGTPGFKMNGVIATVYDNSAAMIYRAELGFEYDQIVNHVQLSAAVVLKFEQWLDGSIT